MAHYKRKRARILGAGGYSSKGLSRRLGDRDDGMTWLNNWPRNHDIMHHTRPLRRSNKVLAQKVLAGDDPENIAWPVPRKPHVYYW